MERVDGKAAGDHGFITCQRVSAWQMEGAPTPIPNVAGGEGGHEAAKPEGVDLYKCESSSPEVV